MEIYTGEAPVWHRVVPVAPEDLRNWRLLTGEAWCILHRVVPVAHKDLATEGKALVRPGVLHSMVPVALEDPDLETWYWGGPV